LRPPPPLFPYTTLFRSLGYAALFVLAFQRPVPGRWLGRHLAPIGRMALSNYLAQTLVAIALFYGVGFGIGPRYGQAGVLAAWLRSEEHTSELQSRENLV